MSAGATQSTAAGQGQQLEAGRVGRAHGLDGSFYVTGARTRLLADASAVSVAGRTATIVRRAGTDARPILRLSGLEDREAAARLRGQPLLVAELAVASLADGEYWAHELEGCEVWGGGARIGRVRSLLELPSCEVLDVALHGGGQVLVPMVHDAIRRLDPPAGRIDVDLVFLGLGDSTVHSKDPGPGLSESPRGPGDLGRRSDS